MTDAHTPTEQETAIYDHMTNGEWDEIDQLHEAATVPPYQPPSTPAPADWNPGPEQWDEDYTNANTHYQADHEPAETERVQNTLERVQSENTEA